MVALGLSYKISNTYLPSIAGTTWRNLPGDLCAMVVIAGKIACDTERAVLAESHKKSHVGRVY